MAFDEPKDRLRHVRQLAAVTRKVLAWKLGISESAIRAHENGQNKISPDMAVKYAAELGVSPTWLLYGIHENAGLGSDKAAAVRTVQVVGVIRDRMYVRQRYHHVESIPPLVISLPDFEGVPLEAYLVYSDESDDTFESYAIVAPESVVGRYLVDEVVLTVKEGELVETGLWQVGGDSEWDVFFRGADLQSKADELVKVRKGAPPGFADVNGVVVAWFSAMRASSIAARMRLQT